MTTNDLMQIHLAFEALHRLRDGASWPADLTERLNALADRIAQNSGLDGSCDCESDDSCVQLQCTEMDQAINTVPSFIEWTKAQYLYELFPNRQWIAEGYDEDYEGFQKADESDLMFARRSISRLRESDESFSNHHESDTTTLQLVQLKKSLESVSFWIASQPGSGGNFSRCLPCAYADEAAARAGLRDYGFRFVEELTTADLPKIGFPQKA